VTCDVQPGTLEACRASLSCVCKAFHDISLIGFIPHSIFSPPSGPPWQPQPIRSTNRSQPSRKISVMPKKKSKKNSAQAVGSTASPSPVEKSFANLNLRGGASVLPTPPPRSMGGKINNIVGAFDRYFGSDLKLENWQRLCRDVGIASELPSIRKCKQVATPPQEVPKVCLADMLSRR
jgi:hypothetical protein